MRNETNTDTNEDRRDDDGRQYGIGAPAVALALLTRQKAAATA